MKNENANGDIKEWPLNMKYMVLKEVFYYMLMGQLGKNLNEVYFLEFDVYTVVW